MEIEDFYGNKTAKRSGVPLMNHIEEGTKLLKHLGACPDTIRAFRLHPIYQTGLSKYFIQLLQEDGPVIAFSVGYACTANAALSNIVFRNNARDWCPLDLRHPIELSETPEVNLMLVADKCQNYKDFLKYHYGKHERSEELDFYFRMWLHALGVTLEQFESYCEIMS